VAALVLAVVLIAGFSLTHQHRTVSATPVARGASATDTIYRRLNHGAVSSIASDYRYPVPQPSMRCGHARTRAVVHATCRDPSARDPAANIVVGQVVSREQGAAGCAPRTIVATRSGGRVLCWWSKQAGAEGIDPASLKD
jgi:hypothetical protein